MVCQTGDYGYAFGFVPIVGTLFDVFIRPSRRTLEIVHEHIREEYQV